MKKNNKNFVLILILILLSISVGFAYLNTSLNINGLTKIKGNSWDIHFDNVVVSENSSLLNVPVIDSDNPTSISYDITLNKPGDNYEFMVDVVNGGTIDAMLSSIEYSDISDEIKNVLDYSFTYADGSEVKVNDLLISNASKILKVSICYKSDILNNELILSNISTKLNITLNYVQSDNSNVVSSESFENDSWDNVIYNVKNGLTSNYKVGDIKTMTLNNKDYRVRISNMSECIDDSMSGSSCGIIFEFVDIPLVNVMNSNSTTLGGWPQSNAYVSLNVNLLNDMPNVISNNIVETKVISSLYGEEEHTAISYDKLFLLSYNEVFGNGNEYTSGFTKQLDYYKSGNINKYFDGKKEEFSLRTPSSFSDYLSSNGSITSNISSGLAPCFKFN